MPTVTLKSAPYSSLVNLTSARLGGQALIASDGLSTWAESILKADAPLGTSGQSEQRGPREPGIAVLHSQRFDHAWIVIRLGLPGVLHALELGTGALESDTLPDERAASIAVDACRVVEDVSFEHLAEGQSVEWIRVLPETPLQPSAQNRYEIPAGHWRERVEAHPWTHIRLNFYGPTLPVTQFRAYGEAIPDWSRYPDDAILNLAAASFGGQVIAADGIFFGNPAELLLPNWPDLEHASAPERDIAKVGESSGWVVVKLGAPGRLEKIEIDSHYLQGFYPKTCAVAGCYQPDLTPDMLTRDTLHWSTLVPETSLRPENRYVFERLPYRNPLTHIRFQARPMAGLRQIRVFGERAQGMW
jgi:allantoicase